MKLFHFLFSAPASGFRRSVRLTAISALAILLSPGLHAQEPVAKFHGRDITGYALDYGFTLKDHEDKNRKLADFSGKVVQISFGFTQCPSICPTTLHRAAEARKLLGADADKFQMIFVTVDPERDSPAVLRSYVAAFDPSFLGMSTTSEELKALSKNFKFTYEKVPTGASYTMDHSTVAYLFDPSGKLRVLMRHDATAQQCADDILNLLREKR